jgi:outer membrane receptor protein involved in Fe transport
LALANAQTIEGKILEAKNKQPIYLANVVVKGTVQGTTTNLDGEFTISPKGKYPITLEISLIGFKTTTLELNKPASNLTVFLEENTELLNEVSVVEQRLSQKQRESALTVEALDALAIKETPAANFYEALGNLKGVDLTSASIGFKIINTRGFNSTSPVRSLQLIDGVDNQAPGLNFSLGNFLGASELDIANVDIIAGASTAFYGPGAFNGVISMTTKDPFLYQGASASVKVGERALTETAVRYAEAFKLFSDDYEDFAFKINLFYLTANDWEADNYDPVDDSPVGKDNPGRYDAVNIYGDESLEANNEFNQYSDVAFNNLPGLGTFYRPGYREPDLVDYDTRNFKGNVGLFYKTRKDVQFNYTFNYGTGTTVYQGENRFSLNNIQFFQNIVEVKKKDKFFIRAYATNEDAGDSYDAVLTAFKMNDATLGSEQDWNRNYRRSWNTRRPPFDFARSFQKAAGFNVAPSLFDSSFFNNEYQNILSEYNSLLRQYHDSLLALDLSFRNRPEPGTGAYDSLFNDITGRTFTEGGSRFFDRSALYHIMGEYQFELPGEFKMRAGGNYRLFAPNSRGNIFDEIIPESVVTDSVGNLISQEYRRITNQEFGAYLGAEKQLFGEVLKANATLRLDKNQNFDFLFSPAGSLVWNINARHTLRASVGRAIRNPTLQDQYLRYDVGRAILLGNINGYDSLVSLESFDDFRSTLRIEDLDYFNVDPIEPERVTTFELGYRGSLLKRFFLDVNAFYSRYTNFIGFQFGLDVTLPNQAPFIPGGIQAYRIAANARDLVTTVGANLGLNYYINDHLTATGNYSFNRLNQANTLNAIVPAFNTPEHKFNLGFNGRSYKLFKKLGHTQGFAVTYKWVEGFIFEGSPQFTGFIESYGLLDAQVSYAFTKQKVNLKLGASNLLNNLVFQVYGGPRVGRLAYFSITYGL